MTLQELELTQTNTHVTEQVAPKKKQSSKEAPAEMGAAMKNAKSAGVNDEVEFADSQLIQITTRTPSSLEELEGSGLGLDVAAIDYKDKSINASALVKHAKERDLVAIDEEADFVDAIYNLMLICKAMGNHNGALQAFKKLNKTNCCDSRILHQIGLLFAALDEYSTAIKWLKVLHFLMSSDAVLLAEIDDHPLLAEEEQQEKCLKKQSAEAADAALPVSQPAQKLSPASDGARKDKLQGIKDVLNRKPLHIKGHQHHCCERELFIRIQSSPDTETFQSRIYSDLVQSRRS